MNFALEIFKKVGKTFVIICCTIVAVLCVVSSYNANNKPSKTNAPDETIASAVDMISGEDILNENIDALN